MANRKIEMYEYRQIIIQMRLGYKDREIARSGLAGRKKCKDIRTIAEFQGWLNPNGKVPTDLELQSTFDKNKCKTIYYLYNYYNNIMLIKYNNIYYLYYLN